MNGKTAQYDYLLVGTGLSGAVFASEAAKLGKRCLAIERRSHIGGNCYTENINGIEVHKYGAHIFHTNYENIWQYVKQYSAFIYFINSPIASYHGELFNLPFNMNTFRQMWGISTPDEAKRIIERQRTEFHKIPQNLEEQAISLVGRDIYEKLIKGYTEKQWGRKCTELLPEVITRVPIRFTFDNNYFNDRFQGIPEKGYTGLIGSMLKNCEVWLNTAFSRNNPELCRLANKIVYTGQIDEYFDYCFGELEYRSLRFEHEVLRTDNYQGVAVMNFTDSETPYTRRIEHKHFVFEKQPDTVITHEYPQEWQVGTEAFYPIINFSNQELLKRYQALAANENNTIFLGRLAQYKYFDMDDAIVNALTTARSELGSVPI